MEIKLPPDMTYQCGDYLAILPTNPENLIKQVLARFGLSWDTTSTISPGGPSMMPADTLLSVHDLLHGYVELFEPASKRVGLALYNSSPQRGRRIS